MQVEVLHVLAEGRALHLLPPPAVFGAAQQLWLGRQQEQDSLPAAFSKLVLDGLLARGLETGSLAADMACVLLAGSDQIVQLSHA